MPSKFFLRLKTMCDEKKAYSISRPHEFDFFVFEGPFYGHWKFKRHRPKAYYRYVTSTFATHTAGEVFSWKKTMRAGGEEKTKAIYLRSVLKKHCGKYSSMEERIITCMHGVEAYNKYLTLHENDKLYIKTLLHSDMYNKLSSRQRFMLLKRLIYMKRKKAWAQTFRMLHPGVRNQLTSPETITKPVISGWTKGILGLRRHLDLDSLVYARWDDVEVQKVILNWKARYPDNNIFDVTVLELMRIEVNPEGRIEAYNKIKEMRNYSPEQVQAVHDELAENKKLRYSFTIDPEQIAREEKYQEFLSNYKPRYTAYKVPEHVRQLETYLDFTLEGTEMAHCVGSYHGYRIHKNPLGFHLSHNDWKEGVPKVSTFDVCVFSIDIDGDRGTLALLICNELLESKKPNAIEFNQFFGRKNSTISDVVLAKGRELAVLNGWNPELIRKGL